MANRAAYLIAAKARPLVIRDAPMPTPEHDQIVVKVGAVAINPVDAGIQNAGIIVEEFPSVIGVDMAGEVTAIGADVEHLKVGDRVLASADSNPGDKVLNGSFQYYTTTHHKMAAKIPDSVSYTDSCVLPLAMATAATALFDKRCMGLDLPRIGSKSNGLTLVVWGGASSVGSCGIQAARAAGYNVITTASKKNFEYCRALGVEEIFDYNDVDVVEQIVMYMQGKKSAGVFDAVMPPESILACNVIAHRSDGFKHVGTVLPEPFPLPEGRPSDVTTSYNWGSWLKENEVGDAVWVDWIPQALADGSLKCKPDAHIVGKGLDDIQGAIDLYAKGGISATKLVVDFVQ
ncbi:hypothetical protein AMS68_004235 [Peltaster fructicola]|uniref:Enoyl reductase (ER) domain-containing protein n=1 Tax=Peltaster fructicola TaxID=286661 RepID=A0A6H0XVT7_9PEZI|nr:hypothetical protein AMS68_004235 [Peltaster fructicola]